MQFHVQWVFTRVRGFWDGTSIELKGGNRDRASQVAVEIDVSGSGDVSHANDNVNRTDDSDATDFGIASATHVTPSMASDTHDTELKKILTSYEELSRQIMQCKHAPTPQSVSQSSVKIGLTPQGSNVTDTRGLSENSTPLTHDKLLSLRELSYLHRRELKIQGGQIGDQGSDSATTVSVGR